MKKSIITLMVTGFLLGWGSVYALSLSTQYIAYVDIEKVFNGFYKTQQAQRELEASKKNQPKEMAELRNRIDALKEQLLTSPTTSLQAQLAGAEAKLEKFPTLLEQKQEILTKNLMAEIYDQIKTVCNKRGYTVVLDKRSAIYGTEEIDITEEVLRRLNAGKPEEVSGERVEKEVPSAPLPGATTSPPGLLEEVTSQFQPESEPEEVPLEKLVTPTTSVQEVETPEELEPPTTSIRPFLEKPTTGPLQLPEELQPPTTE